MGHTFGDILPPKDFVENVRGYGKTGIDLPSVQPEKQMVVGGAAHFDRFNEAELHSFFVIVAGYPRSVGQRR